MKDHRLLSSSFCSVLFYIFLGFCFAWSEPSETKPNAVEISRINDVFSKINEVYKSYGIKSIESNGGWYEEFKRVEAYSQMLLVDIADSEKKYFFTFLDGDNRLIAFNNDRLYDELFESSQAKLYDKPTQPTWTQEKALDLATKFLSIFNNRPDVILGKPTVEYVHSLHRLDKTYTGFWQIDWYRVDAEGHRFLSSEYISARIAEDQGLISFGINMPAHYTEVPGKEITQEEAVDKARKFAQSTASWGVIGSTFGQGKLDSNPSPRGQYLAIVTPNHLLQSSSLPLNHDLNARLAWVIWFNWQNPNEPKSGQAISVWIDAHTGEYLGGDAAL